MRLGHSIRRPEDFINEARLSSAMERAAIAQKRIRTIKKNLARHNRLPGGGSDFVWTVYEEELAAATAKLATAQNEIGDLRVLGRTQQSRYIRRQSPPGAAEKFLLLVLPHRIAEPVLGDLEERFRIIAKKHGERFARVWFWRWVLGSVLPGLRMRITAAVSAGTVAEVVRRLLLR